MIQTTVEELGKAMREVRVSVVRYEESLHMGLAPEYRTELLNDAMSSAAYARRLLVAKTADEFFPQSMLSLAERELTRLQQILRQLGRPT